MAWVSYSTLVKLRSVKRSASERLKIIIERRIKLKSNYLWNCLWSSPIWIAERKKSSRSCCFFFVELYAFKSSQNPKTSFRCGVVKNKSGIFQHKFMLAHFWSSLFCFRESSKNVLGMPKLFEGLKTNSNCFIAPDGSVVTEATLWAHRCLI